MVAGRLQQTEQARGPILLVDDEPYILRSLSYLLTREGYAVETASNGEEGLERLRMVHPPLVFLDIMMPRMNGYEVCEQIKQDPALAATYVIMLSAKGQQIDRERAMGYLWQGPPSLPRSLQLEWRFVVVRWLGIFIVAPGLLLTNLAPGRLLVAYAVLALAGIYNLTVQLMMRRRPEVIANGYLTV